MPDWTARDDSIPILDHWRSLRNPNVARMFDVDAQEMERLTNFTRDNQTGK